MCVCFIFHYFILVFLFISLYQLIIHSERFLRPQTNQKSSFHSFCLSLSILNIVAWVFFCFSIQAGGNGKEYEYEHIDMIPRHAILIVGESRFAQFEQCVHTQRFATSWRSEFFSGENCEFKTTFEWEVVQYFGVRCHFYSVVSFHIVFLFVLGNGW